VGDDDIDTSDCPGVGLDGEDSNTFVVSTVFVVAESNKFETVAD
jgi:hypothetical protein